MPPFKMRDSSPTKSMAWCSSRQKTTMKSMSRAASAFPLFDTLAGFTTAAEPPAQPSVKPPWRFRVEPATTALFIVHSTNDQKLDLASVSRVGRPTPIQLKSISAGAPLSGCSLRLLGSPCSPGDICMNSVRPVKTSDELRWPTVDMLPTTPRPSSTADPLH